MKSIVPAARGSALSLTVVAVLVGCTSENPFDRDGSGGDATAFDGANGCTAAGVVVCSGNSARTCDARGELGAPVDCAEQRCVAGMGCRLCAPGTRGCSDANAPQVCNADGTAYTPGEPCAGGTACDNGACVNLCDRAREQNSYIGCDYWTTTLLNAQLGSIPSNPSNPFSPPVGVEGFPFAIAVANPQRVPANVRIVGGGLGPGGAVRRAVMPGTLEVINLPWVNAIAQTTSAMDVTRRLGTSAFAAGGAYNIVSSVPITVYQFNPLSFRDVRRPACELTDRACFSFTNDASLLLPTTVLTGNYTAVSWPSVASTDQVGFQTSTLSGFVTIVAVADSPTSVSVALTGGVRAGTMVAAAGPGMTVTRTMNAGDVWQLASAEVPVAACRRFAEEFRPGQYVCMPDRRFDLTGSVITADHPVAVFGGHDCAQVPLNRAACDHMEEQLFPNETLGARYFVSRTQPQQARREPNVVRIVSNRADNALTFDPPEAHAAVTLGRGEYIDFEQADDFEVAGTGPFAVAQLFVGQNYFGNSAMLPVGTVGDPSLVLEVPVEQWRTSYAFLAPATYPRTFVNVVARAGAAITLDGMPLDATPTTVGMYDVYRVNLSTRTGAHRIESAAGVPFSIKVYGFGPYTSYMYPGGLDLSRINPPG